MHITMIDIYIRSIKVTKLKMLIENTSSLNIKLPCYKIGYYEATNKKSQVKNKICIAKAAPKNMNFRQLKNH